MGSGEDVIEPSILGLLALLKEGLAPYLTGGNGRIPKERDEQDGKLSWDGTLST